MVGTVAASAPNGYVLDGRLNDSFRAAFLLLDKGIGVRRASQPSRRRQRQDRRLPGRRPATSRRSRSRPAWTSSRSKAPIDDRRLRASQAAHRDAAALRRRQHGRGLDATDVRAVQRARRSRSWTPRSRPAASRRSTTPSSCPPTRSPAMTGERPPAGPGRRWRRRWVRRRSGQHARRVPQRVRRRGREGAAGVRAEGRDAC